MLSRSLSCCLAASALLLATPVWAGSAEDEARKLFEEGATAERAGQRAQACAKFRESLGLVREIGPLSKVKDCDVSEGKLVSAEANLRELVTRWPQPGPELEALKAELSNVQQRTPRLTIKLKTGAPAGISVRLDGRAVDFPADDRPVDPGKHEILIDVPGRPLDRVAIELKDGERSAVEVPSTTPVEPPVPPPAASSGLGGLGIAGIVVGAIGVGGFIGAGVTGKLVLDKQDEFELGHCGAEDALPDVASCGALASDGDTLLVANGVMWGVGIAGVAVGATLLIIDLVGSPASEPSPTKASLGVRPGYAELTITF